MNTNNNLHYKTVKQPLIIKYKGYTYEKNVGDSLYYLNNDFHVEEGKIVSIKVKRSNDYKVEEDCYDRYDDKTVIITYAKYIYEIKLDTGLFIKTFLRINVDRVNRGSDSIIFNDKIFNIAAKSKTYYYKPGYNIFPERHLLLEYEFYTKKHITEWLEKEYINSLKEKEQNFIDTKKELKKISNSIKSLHKIKEEHLKFLQVLLEENNENLLE